VGFGFVRFALCFELSSDVCDVEDGLVFGILYALLTFGVDGVDFKLGFVAGLLKASVAVISDVGQVNIEVLKGGDSCLFVQGRGLSFANFHGLVFGPGFEVCGFVCDVFHYARVCFERGGVSINDNLNNLVESESLLLMDPFHDFLVEIARILVQD
jgi:hypothetical protein